MKKISAYILGAVFGLAAVSCNPLLEQTSPSTFDAAVVYSNFQLAEGTIFGITEAFCEVNSYRGRFLPWYGFNTDIEWYNTFKPGDGKTDIASYDCQPNNAQLNLANGPFPLMYMGIERANLVIEGLRGNADLSDPDMAYLLGEALTLRAFIYYDLTKAWGDVPARFSSLTSETIYAPKESRDVIYRQILADLDEAIPYLYYPGASAMTSRTDRVNKVFAEGLYARIALAASGYALRPEDGKVGTGDPGSIRLSSDPELQKDVLYPKVLAYLEDAINSGSASLEADYRKMWFNLNNMNNMAAGPAYETLFVIPFGEGRGRWNFTFAINSEGASISGGVSRGGDAGPVPTMYWKYGDNDVRRDITCVNYKWTKDNDIVPSGIDKWYFGKFRFEWMEAQPYGGGNDDGIKPVVMRYSDILLMAAEVANYLGKSLDAKDYLQQVRARACGEDAAATYVAGLSGEDAIFNAIVDERALEFCGEFLRKADLIRWNLLKTKLDEARADMRKLRSLEAPYDFLTDVIYYKMNDDEKGITIYGFNRGESEAKGSDWEESKAYFTKIADDKGAAAHLYDGRIDGIYINDPEQYMFWPIFNDTMTNSQGYIQNDYGYTSTGK